MKAGIDAGSLTTGALERINDRLSSAEDRTEDESRTLNAVQCELRRRA